MECQRFQHLIKSTQQILNKRDVDECRYTLNEKVEMQKKMQNFENKRSVVKKD